MFTETRIVMRKALVTGANRGIGLAIAAGLAKYPDIQVLLGSRNLRDGEKAAANIKGNVAAVALDLSDQAQLKKQYAAIVAAHGEVDILINNAGVLEDGNLLEVSDEKFQLSLRVNFLAPFDLIRLAVPGMIKRRYGRIVNVSSGWGSFAEGLTGPAAYSVTKTALNALTFSLSKNLPHDVKVNSMCPGGCGHAWAAKAQAVRQRRGRTPRSGWQPCRRMVSMADFFATARQLTGEITREQYARSFKHELEEFAGTNAFGKNWQNSAFLRLAEPVELLMDSIKPA